MTFSLITSLENSLEGRKGLSVQWTLRVLRASGEFFFQFNMFLASKKTNRFNYSFSTHIVESKLPEGNIATVNQ